MNRYAPIVLAWSGSVLLLAACDAAVDDRREAGVEGQPSPPAHVVAFPSDVDSLAPTRLVYVPVYSHISYRDRREVQLASTLSVRNTDLDRAIIVVGIRYYDSAGNLVRRFVEEPIRIGPMASSSFLVPEEDRTGGSGANFLVEWTADGRVSEPVVEAVMIGTGGAQGISFISVGRTLERVPEDPPGP